MGSSIASLEQFEQDHFFEEVVINAQPVVYRGLCQHWPMVQHGLDSNQALLRYLSHLDSGKQVAYFLGKPEIDGRFYYRDDFSGFNFESGSGKLSQVLEKLDQYTKLDAPPSLYVGSTPTSLLLPDFVAQNPFPALDKLTVPRIWIGNKSRVAAHYDIPMNLACEVAGKRRFTLFPTEQIKNLYVGPLDFTPAGQSLSLVDFHKPDFKRFPKFKTALEHAIVVDLEPGDALYIPSLWWHHVESTGSLNVLVNYWWQGGASEMDLPFNTLIHAFLSLRERPASERKAWRTLFDHYVFNANDSTLEHIPKHVRGVLAELNPQQAKKLKAYLLKNLNRR